MLQSLCSWKVLHRLQKNQVRSYIACGVATLHVSSAAAEVRLLHVVPTALKARPLHTTNMLPCSLQDPPCNLLECKEARWLVLQPTWMQRGTLGGPATYLDEKRHAGWSCRF